MDCSGLSWIQLFGLVQREETGRAQKVHLHLLPLKHTVAGAKPPQESQERILATKALLNVQQHTPDGRKTWLVSDGARCYKGLAKKFQLKHGACNHAKGVFVKKIRRGRQTLLKAHTGAVDSVWNLLKNSVPSSLATCKGKRPNPLLMQYCQQWQWRWVQKQNLFQSTGRQLYREAFG